MANCEYIDQQRSGPNGWYCVKIGHIHDPSLRENYCRFSTRCEHCPIRGGDDRYRKPQKSEPKPSRPAPVYHQEETVTPSGGSRGSSGGGFSFWDGVGEMFSFGRLVLVLSVIVFGFFMILHLFGLTGPWVDMQLPAEASVQDTVLYTVSRDKDSPFKIHRTSFEEDGSVHAVTQLGHNDVYFLQDDVSVWLGTCHVLHLNTAVVYDSSYEEIQQQLYRSLLVELRNTDGAPIASPLTVTDESFQPQRCVNLGGNRYVILLPDSVLNPVLTFRAEGFEPYTVQMDLANRLTQAVVTLCAEGENG